MSENLTARLKSAGIDAKKTDITKVPLSSIRFPPKSSPIWHPRSELPIDEPLCADIVEKCEIEEPILVREDTIRKGGEAVKVLTIVDGACRVLNGREAERRLHESGVLDTDKELWVKIKLFKGDDKALLLARQRADSNPLKRAHTPSVLACIFRQLAALECPIEEMLTVAPRSMAKADVEAMLSWDNLSPEVKSAFDNGAPIGIIRAVLDTPREEQFARLTALIGAGVTHMKGATRVLNAEKKRDKITAVADISVYAPGVEAASNPIGAPPTPPSAIRVAVQRPHPKTVRKVVDAIKSLADGGQLQEYYSQECFAAGMVQGILWTLGEDVQKELPADILAKLINALPKGQQ